MLYVLFEKLAKISDWSIIDFQITSELVFGHAFFSSQTGCCMHRSGRKNILGKRRSGLNTSGDLWKLPFCTRALLQKEHWEDERRTLVCQPHQLRTTTKIELRYILRDILSRAFTPILQRRGRNSHSLSLSAPFLPDRSTTEKSWEGERACCCDGGSVVGLLVVEETIPSERFFFFLRLLSSLCPLTHLRPHSFILRAYPFPALSRGANARPKEIHNIKKCGEWCLLLQKELKGQFCRNLDQGFFHFPWRGSWVLSFFWKDEVCASIQMKKKVVGAEWMMSLQSLPPHEKASSEERRTRLRKSPRKNGENSSMSEGGKSFSIHCSKTRLKKKEAKATGGKRALSNSITMLLLCCRQSLVYV